jgi:hypothetical protein
MADIPDAPLQAVDRRDDRERSALGDETLGPAPAELLDAAHFKEFGPLFKNVYEEVRDGRYLSAINSRFIRMVNEALGVKTVISTSRDYRLVDGQTERLVDLCRQSGRTNMYQDRRRGASGGLQQRRNCDPPWTTRLP